MSWYNLPVNVILVLKVQCRDNIIQIKIEEKESKTLTFLHT